MPIPTAEGSPASPDDERRHWRFMNFIAHQLRTPLTAIRGYAQLIQRRGTYHPVAVEAIVRETGRLEGMIQDMLEVARLQGGRFELHPSWVDLVQLAEQRAERARARAGNRVIRVEGPPEGLRGWWDGERVARIFDNLLAIAIAASPPEAEVLIRSTAVGPEAQVAIIDRGAGLTPEGLAVLFEPLRSPEAGLRPPRMGMGLYLARAFAEAHGGTVTGVSIPGQGSTFTLHLPRAHFSAPEG